MADFPTINLPGVSTTPPEQAPTYTNPSLNFDENENPSVGELKEAGAEALRTTPQALGGMAAGAALAGTAAPVYEALAATGPWGVAGAGVIAAGLFGVGSFGGGEATKAAGDWLRKATSSPEKIAAEDAAIAKGQMEHRLGAIAGDLIPQFALGGLNPKGVGEAAVAAKELMAASKTEGGVKAWLSTVDNAKKFQTLNNVVIGAGMAGGQDAINQIGSGHDFNSLEFAANLGLGTLMNKPTKLGEWAASPGEIISKRLYGDPSAVLYKNLADAPKPEDVLSEVKARALNGGDFDAAKPIAEQLPPEVKPQEVSVVSLETPIVETHPSQPVADETNPKVSEPGRQEVPREAQTSQEPLKPAPQHAPQEASPPDIVKPSIKADQEATPTSAPRNEGDELKVRVAEAVNRVFSPETIKAANDSLSPEHAMVLNQYAAAKGLTPEQRVMLGGMHGLENLEQRGIIKRGDMETITQQVHASYGKNNPEMIEGLKKLQYDLPNPWTTRLRRYVASNMKESDPHFKEVQAMNDFQNKQWAFGGHAMQQITLDNEQSVEKQLRKDFQEKRKSANDKEKATTYTKAAEDKAVEEAKVKVRELKRTTDAEREGNARVAKRDQGINDEVAKKVKEADEPLTDEERLEKEKERIRWQIDKLNEQISNGERDAQPEKPKDVTDQELENLKSERDKLGIQLDKIDPRDPKQKTLSGTLRAKRNGLLKSINELERQIGAGKRDEKIKPVMPKEKEIDGLRKKQEALKARLEEISPKEDPRKNAKTDAVVREFTGEAKPPSKPKAKPLDPKEVAERIKNEALIGQKSDEAKIRSILSSYGLPKVDEAAAKIAQHHNDFVVEIKKDFENRLKPLIGSPKHSTPFTPMAKHVLANRDAYLDGFLKGAFRSPDEYLKWSVDKPQLHQLTTQDGVRGVSSDWVSLDAVVKKGMLDQADPFTKGLLERRVKEAMEAPLTSLQRKIEKAYAFRLFGLLSSARPSARVLIGQHLIMGMEKMSRAFAPFADGAAKIFNGGKEVKTFGNGKMLTTQDYYGHHVYDPISQMQNLMSGTLSSVGMSPKEARKLSWNAAIAVMGSRKEMGAGQVDQISYRVMRNAFNTPGVLDRLGNGMRTWVIATHGSVSWQVYQHAFNDSIAQQAHLVRNGQLSGIDVGRAVADAQRAINLNETWLSKHFLSIRKTLDRLTGEITGGTVKLGSLVVPIAQVPTSLLVKSVEYSPLGLIKGFLYDGIYKGTMAKEFDQMKFTQAIIRGLAGTVSAFVIGATLKAMGVMQTSLPENYQEKKMMMQEGYRENSINVSALQRAFISGQIFGKQEWRNGDLIVPYGFAMPLSLSMTMGADAYGKATDPKFGSLSGMEKIQNVLAGIPGTAEREITNDSMFRGIAQIMQGFDQKEGSGGDKMLAAIQQSASDNVASFIPAFIRMTRDMSDPYQRVTDKGDFVSQAATKIQNDLPGASMTLPVQMNVFGSPIQKAYNLAIQYANATLSPTNLQTLQLTPEGVESQRLFESTGKSGALFHTAPVTLRYTQDGVAHSMILNTQQRNQFQQQIGVDTMKLVSTDMANGSWQQMSDVDRAKAIGKAQTASMTYAKMKFLGHEPSKVSKLVRMLQEDEQMEVATGDAAPAQ